MYHPTDPFYIQSRDIKTGAHVPTPADRDMISRLTALCGANVLNFYFDAVETSKGYRVQHIRVILDTIAVCKTLGDSGPHTAIIQQCMQYFKDYNPAHCDPMKNDFFPYHDAMPYPETLLAFLPLEAVELQVASRLADADIKAIAPAYKDIWVISANGDWRTVFYYTDEQLEQNPHNGITNAIKMDILAALKKYDAFGYFGLHSLQVQFDSKEAFDRDFSGNWHYYYQ